MQVVAAAVEQVHQVVEDLARRTVDVHVRIRALHEPTKVRFGGSVLALFRASLGLPLGLHPVQLQEQVFAVGVRAPTVQGKLVAVGIGEAVDLPVIGETVAVGVLQCLVGVARDGHARAQRAIVTLPHTSVVAVSVVRAGFCGLLVATPASEVGTLELGVQLVAFAHVDGVLVRSRFRRADRVVMGQQPVREHQLQVLLTGGASQLHPHVNVLRCNGERAHKLHAEFRVSVGQGDNVAFVVGGGLDLGVLAREFDLLPVRIGIQVERRRHQAVGEAVVHQPGHAALVHVNVLESFGGTGGDADLVALGQVDVRTCLCRKREASGDAKCDGSRDRFLTCVHHVSLHPLP